MTAWRRGIRMTIKLLIMNTIDDVAGKNPRTGNIRGDQTEIRLPTLCPKDRRVNKRIKVMEPNVSVFE
jgi:hypothetical protein